jgi:hypothetical protein
MASDKERALLVPHVANPEGPQPTDEAGAMATDPDQSAVGRNEGAGQEGSAPARVGDVQELEAAELREIEDRLRYLGYID